MSEVARAETDAEMLTRVRSEFTSLVKEARLLISKVNEDKTPQLELSTGFVARFSKRLLIGETSCSNCEGAFPYSGGVKIGLPNSLMGHLCGLECATAWLRNKRDK